MLNPYMVLPWSHNLARLYAGSAGEVINGRPIIGDFVRRVDKQNIIITYLQLSFSISVLSLDQMWEMHNRYDMYLHIRITNATYAICLYIYT